MAWTRIYRLKRTRTSHKGVGLLPWVRSGEGPRMDAVIISVGMELVTGLTVDTNAAWLSSELAAVGVQAQRHVTIGDHGSALAEEVRRAAAENSWIVVTGGLGPTTDDISRQAVAEALGVELRVDPDALRQIRLFFETHGYRWSESNARQAAVPEGADLIPNKWGTAPGIHARIGQSEVFCLPGVPREMKAMFQAAVLPQIAPSQVGPVLMCRSLRCFGAGESTIGEQIADLMKPGGEVVVGTTAQEGMISIRLVARARTPALACGLLDARSAVIKDRLGGLVFGEEDVSLEAVVGRLLLGRASTVTTAESCTGGLLAKRLTDVPGSSGYFQRGFVTYANEAKVGVLGVEAQIIQDHGAVSAEAAAAMASGARRSAGAGYALSATGVAGPGGGSESKPVGLVYIALASSDGCEARDCRFGQHLPRAEIRDRACSVALDMLRRKLLEV